MDVSFLLPVDANRPNAAENVIDRINSYKTDMTYEICVYSQKEVSGPNVRFLHEPRKLGPIKGFNRLYRECSAGDWLVVLTDDCGFCPRTYDAIKEFSTIPRRFKVMNINYGDYHCVLGSYGDRIGSILGLDEHIPRHPLMRFPVFHRQTVEEHLDRCIWHPEFYYHAADNWLGYWLGEMGEPGYQYYLKNELTNTPLTNDYYCVQDCNTYYALVHNFMAGFTQYVHHDSSTEQRLKP
jgi:hypothetical protein